MVHTLLVHTFQYISNCHISRQKKRTWRKYRKYILQVSVFIYCACMHAHTTHTHTHNLNDNAYYTNVMYTFYLAVTTRHIWHKVRTPRQYQYTNCWRTNVSLNWMKYCRDLLIGINTNMCTMIVLCLMYIYSLCFNWGDHSNNHILCEERSWEDKSL